MLKIYKNFFCGRKTFAVVLMTILLLYLTFLGTTDLLSGAVESPFIEWSFLAFYVFAIWVGFPCFVYLVDIFTYRKS